MKSIFALFIIAAIVVAQELVYNSHPFTAEQQNALLEQVNQLRRQVNQGTLKFADGSSFPQGNLQEVAWSDSLETMAQQAVNECRYANLANLGYEFKLKMDSSSFIQPSEIITEDYLYANLQKALGALKQQDVSDFQSQENELAKVLAHSLQEGLSEFGCAAATCSKGPAQNKKYTLFFQCLFAPKVSVHQALYKPVVQQAAQPVDQQAESPVVQQAEQPVVQQAEQPVDQQQAEQPVDQQQAEQPVDQQQAEQPVDQQQAEQPVDQQAQSQNQQQDAANGNQSVADQLSQEEKKFLDDKEFNKGGMNGKPTFSPVEKLQILAEHNKFRQQLCQGLFAQNNNDLWPKSVNGIPDLVWNSDNEAFAQQYVQKCQWAHSSSEERGQRGENLFSSEWRPVPEYVVEQWVAEGRNSQAIPASTYTSLQESQVSGVQVGHFTQVVWQKTTSVGCARAHCPHVTVNGQKTEAKYLVSCVYSAQGNVIGEPIYV